MKYNKEKACYEPLKKKKKSTEIHIQLAHVGLVPMDMPDFWLGTPFDGNEWLQSCARGFCALELVIIRLADIISWLGSMIWFDDLWIIDMQKCWG